MGDGPHVALKGTPGCPAGQTFRSGRYTSRTPSSRARLRGSSYPLEL